MNKSIFVRVQPMAGGEPLMCRQNVDKRIKALGGSVVFGWEVHRDAGTLPGSGPFLGDLYQCHTAHCVWRSPEGELRCVTPKFDGEVRGNLAMADWPGRIEFIPDPSLAWEGRCPVTSRYIAVDKRLTTACEYMSRSGKCLHEGDLGGCRYWTGKGNAAAQRAGVPIRWDVPADNSMLEVVKAMNCRW